jgi:AcrR family transcriptional regulator
MPIERSRNDRGQGGRLREEIIAAAMAVIDESADPSPLTLRGVARRAGISAPSIYAHFDDVEAVADAALKRGFAELDDAVAQAMAGAPTARDALIDGCLAYVRHGWEHRSRYRFMFAASGFAPDAVRTFARIEDALGTCAAAGSSRSTDPHADAFLVWTAMHGIATLQKPAREDLRRLGPIDRVVAAETLVCRIAGLDPADGR